MIRIDALGRTRSLDPRRTVGAALCLLALTAKSATARADGAGDTAAAHALFNEARKLVEAGKFVEACPKFQESARLKPGIGTRFNLADCWEKLGRTASAWSEFLEVASAAKAQGQKERETVARDRAKALEAKLAYLTIDAAETDPQLRVTRDGAEVGHGAFGSPVPVDPGAHVIEATSPTKKPWSLNQNVASGAKERVTIPKLEPGDAAPPANAPEPAVVAVTPAQAPIAPLVGSEGERGEPGLGVQRAIGLAAGGLGVVGVVAGTVFAVRYGSKNSEAKSVCPTNVCDSQQIQHHTELINDAKELRTLSYVGFGAGGALLVTGAVLFLTAPKTGNAAAKLSVLPIASPTTRGLAVSGRF
jgi:hypothetical protein